MTRLDRKVGLERPDVPPNVVFDPAAALITDAEIVQRHLAAMVNDTRSEEVGIQLFNYSEMKDVLHFGTAFYRL